MKLVDFGLAKATSQIEITDPGVVKGKFSYLSPEAASGEEVDHRADVFAVGIILWEMLTGRRLFYGETDYQTVELVRQRASPVDRAAQPARSSPSSRRSSARRWPSAIGRSLPERGRPQDALAQYLFSRGMKVTARDIAELVRGCLEDKAHAVGRGPAQDQHHRHLLQDEIAKFTSVDSEEEEAGARPLSADELSPRSSAPQAPPDGGFVDPRAWAEERLTPVMGIAEVDALEARRTSKDLPPVAGRAADAPIGRRSRADAAARPPPRRARGRRRPDAGAGVAGLGAGADTGPAARARAGTARARRNRAWRRVARQRRARAS